MTDILPLLLAGSAGIVLGTMFYGGLWLTIQKSVASSRPALWIFTSLLVRMALVLTGFYFVAGSHWERIALCLLGFLAARGGVIWMTRLPKKDMTSSTQEASHAP